MLALPRANTLCDWPFRAAFMVNFSSINVYNFAAFGFCFVTFAWCAGMSPAVSHKEPGMPNILRTPEGKKFLIAVAMVFIVALSVVTKVTFQGVEDQYDLPMSSWTTSMFIIQGAWVAIYSLVFTVIGSLPFAFYFLVPKDGRG